MIIKMSALSATFFFSTLVFAIQDTDANETWAKMRFGRLTPHPGYWTTDPQLIEEFVPSGIGYQVYQLSDYSVLHNHGLYWSNEEHQDTSYDMHASVIVFKNEQRVFVARGYRYDKFQIDSNTDKFSFEHWTGVMGDNQITIYNFSVESGVLKVTTYTRSTRAQ